MYLPFRLPIETQCNFEQKIQHRTKAVNQRTEDSHEPDGVLTTTRTCVSEKKKPAFHSADLRRGPTDKTVDLLDVQMYERGHNSP